ncbi:MAG: DUF2341 domain-containing protein, partial [Verrucomicrobiota bacterium]
MQETSPVKLMKRISIILCLFAAGLVPARAAIIHQESFESPPTGMTWQMFTNTIDSPPTTSGSDYFYRLNSVGFTGSDPDYSPFPDNPDGDFYIVAEDTDADTPAGSNGLMSITLPAVNVAGYTNVMVAVALAESLGNIEADDFVELQAKINGTGIFQRVMSWRRPGSSGGIIQEDTDNDGVGDGTAIPANNNFLDFTYSISGGPLTTVQVRVLVLMDGPGEEVAVDNIRVIGDLDAPVLNVLGTDASVITNGTVTPLTSAGTDFGSFFSGDNDSHVFTVTNIGLQTLNLTGTPRVAVSGHPGFTVTAQPGSSTLTSGGASSTFTLQFAAGVSGVRTATVSILSNDTNSNPYTFLVQAQVINLSDWSEEMKITFCGYNPAAAGTLTNFPALVSVSQSISNFLYSDFASSLGYDLIFTDSNKSQILNYEFQNWDTNGTSRVWVQVPIIDGTGSCIYAYWGNAADTAQKAYTTNGATWSEGYVGVWHMESANPSDATGNGNDGTGNGGAATGSGIIGTAVSLDGTDDYIDVAETHKLPIYNNGIDDRFTVEGWLNAASGQANGRRIYGEGNTADATMHFSFLTGTPTESDNDRVFLRDNDGDNLETALGGIDNVLDSTWNYFAWTRDGGDFDHWIDGIEDTSDAFSYTEDTATFNTTTFGALERTAVAFHFAGLIDEFRVSCVERSSNWLWATHQTIASNANFNCYLVTPGGAEINVLGTNTALIANGSTTPLVADGTDFGSINVTNAGLGHVFTITNVGATNLFLTNSPVVGVTGHADFTVSVQPAGTNVAVSNAVTFTVLFDPDVVGLRTATVRIASTDTKNNPFTFLVQGTGVTPEMAIEGTNAAVIADGDSTPARADGSHFGYVDTVGASQDHTFTLRNSGTFALFLTNQPNAIVVNGHPDFTVQTQPAQTNVNIAGTVTFTIRFDAVAIGVRTATVSVLNTDLDENPYTFRVQGVGITPEIGVLGTNGAVIADNDFTPSVADGTDFGTNSAFMGSSVHIFSITNLGGSTLNLSGSPRVDVIGDTPEFLVTAQPGASVGSNSVTTFTMTFDPSGIGTFTARVSIANNDTNENPYEFAVTGYGADPVMTVFGTNGAPVANGDMTPTAVDGTHFGTNFTVLGATTNVFGIGNSGTFELNLTGTPRVAISGPGAANFTVSAQPATPVGTNAGVSFTMVFDPAAVGASTATVTILNNDQDDDPYTFTIAGVGVGPEIDILGINLASITNNDNSPITADGTDFGSVNICTGMAVVHCFTVTNAGTFPLTLTNDVSIRGNTNVFTISMQPPFSNYPSAGPTSSNAFYVLFDPITLQSGATYTATVEVFSNDDDESPYEFLVRGVALAPDIGILGTNGALQNKPEDLTPTAAEGTDFGTNLILTTEDHVFTVTNRGDLTLFLTNTPSVQFVNLGDTNQFSIIQPGSTSIAAGATTTFTIRYQPTAVGSHFVFVDIYSSDKDEDRVRLRIVGAAVPPNPEIEIRGTNGVAVLTDGQTATDVAEGTDFGSIAVVSGSKDHTFTVRNTGQSTLSLSGTPTIAISGHADFTVVPGGPGSTNIAIGASDVFTIRFDPGVAGVRTATVTIANNDQDEDPFTFLVEGLGIVPISDIEVYSTNNLNIANGDVTPIIT